MADRPSNPDEAWERSMLKGLDAFFTHEPQPSPSPSTPPPDTKEETPRAVGPDRSATDIEAMLSAFERHADPPADPEPSVVERVPFSEDAAAGDHRACAGPRLRAAQTGAAISDRRRPRWRVALRVRARIADERLPRKRAIELHASGLRGAGPATEPEEAKTDAPAHRCPRSRGDRPFDRRARRGRMDRMASDESAADLSRRKSWREVIASGDRGADSDATRSARSRRARRALLRRSHTRRWRRRRRNLRLGLRLRRPRHRHRPLRRTRRRRPSQQLPRGTGQGG